MTYQVHPSISAPTDFRKAISSRTFSELADSSVVWELRANRERVKCFVRGADLAEKSIVE